MARSLDEINKLEVRLLGLAPSARSEVRRLAEIARDGLAPASVFVAVTDTAGTERIMTMDQYKRMSATDLAHVSLRLLDEKTARGIMES